VDPTDPCIADGVCRPESMCPSIDGSMFYTTTAPDDETTSTTFEYDPSTTSAESCIPVNHINDNPGYYTCDCVDPTDPCIADGVCRPESMCPSIDGSMFYTTTAPEQCKSWCNSHTAHWILKCNFDMCGGCTECDLSYNQKSNCMNWCNAHDAPWNPTKCGWVKCAGCYECII